MKTFETGAVRSNDAEEVRYDLISPHILESLARTYAEGARKYGDNNWMKGLPSSDLLNRVYRHLDKWRLGDTSEDHLGHALWNLGAIIHFLKERPELVTRPFMGVDADAQRREVWRKAEIVPCESQVELVRRESVLPLPNAFCSECGSIGEHATYCSRRTKEHSIQWIEEVPPCDECGAIVQVTGHASGCSELLMARKPGSQT